mmetsp:Transcript_21815/g.33753  ORF Transcript_21815/g.33753 Transcript_21815/m.33753 type:complete len:287 (-) Transcript_21815:2042-2902(-)
MVQVKADDVFPVIGPLVGLLCLFVVAFALLGLGHHNQDGGRGDLFHERSSFVEQLDLDVDTHSLLHQAALLIELSSLLPLLHLLAHAGNFDDDGLVVDVAGDAEASLDVAHLNRSSGDTSIALSVVLLVVHFVFLLLLLGQESFLVEFLGLNSVALVLHLGSQLATDELFFLRSNLLGQLQSLEPVLKVHSHLKSKLGLGALQEGFLSDVVLEEDGSHVALEHLLLRFVLDALNRVNHTHVLAHLEGGLSVGQLQELEALLSKTFEELERVSLAALGHFDTVLVPV